MKTMIWVSALALSSLGFAKGIDSLKRMPSSDDGVRKVKIGSYELKLYPDSEDLESDEISVSIKDLADSDACNSAAAGAHYTFQQEGDCTKLELYLYDGKLLQDFGSYCKSDVLKSADHTYQIKQVLDRCERFKKPRKEIIDGKEVSLPIGGGIKHDDLYRDPLVRLVDESGRVWVTTSKLVHYFIELNRKQVLEETGVCKSKTIYFGYKPAQKCAVENAKKQVQQACADMGGKPALNTLKEEKAPWMCYTEMFNEQFCATFSMRCSF